MSLYQVVSATPINSRTIVLVFSENVDTALSATTNPSNYGVSSGLPVRKVVFDTNPAAVRLYTDEQEFKSYVVTVSSSVTSGLGSTLNPLFQTGTFTGWSSEPKFTVRAQSDLSVQVVFYQEMVNDSALVDPTNYVISALDGVTIGVVSVSYSLPIPATVTNHGITVTRNPVRATLRLASPLQAGTPYVLTVSSITAVPGLDIQPASSVFTWQKRSLQASVPLSRFTGEVRAPRPDLTLSEVLTIHENLVVDLWAYAGGNYETVPVEDLQIYEALTVDPPSQQQGLPPPVKSLFGNPDGLVFFSPSLVPGGPSGSAIQVDEVSACTRTSDIYTFPQPIDPSPLYTFGGATGSTLNSASLFTNFYRMNEAKLDLSYHPLDEVAPAIDVGASITLKQIYPPARVALLNSPGWVLFDNGAPPPYPFITTDNLTALPAPTAGIAHNFINPSEAIDRQESLSLLHTAAVTVSDAIVLVEDFDLSPGLNMVQSNVTDAVTVAEALTVNPIAVVIATESLMLSETVVVIP